MKMIRKRFSAFGVRVFLGIKIEESVTNPSASEPKRISTMISMIKSIEVTPVILVCFCFCTLSILYHENEAL